MEINGSIYIVVAAGGVEASPSPFENPVEILNTASPESGWFIGI